MQPVDSEQTRPAIRVAVAAPYPEMVAIHASTAEYADDVEVCGMISSADAVFDQTRLLQPDVLLLSDELGVDRPDAFAQLTALAPNTRLVILAGSGSSRTPMIADAVLSHDAPADELCAAIIAAAGRHGVEAAPPAHSRAETDEPATPEAAAGEEPPAGAPARVVLVFGGKGGIGKSVVATNLATALAVDGARVAMIDLNLQYGDVGVLLHLESHPISIESVARDGDQVDPDVLERALATSAEGVRVLLAPSSPESGDLVTGPSLEAILNELSRRYDYVVVDSPAHLEERIIGVMEVADDILLVSSFGITSVKDTKMTLRLLQSLGIDRERVALVLNQTRQRAGFQAEEIEKSLRFPVLSTLPYEPRMDESVDAGRPVVLTEPRGGFSRRLRIVVDHVARARDSAAPARVRRHAAAWRLRFGR